MSYCKDGWSRLDLGKREEIEQRQAADMFTDCDKDARNGLEMQCSHSGKKKKNTKERRA